MKFHGGKLFTESDLRFISHIQNLNKPAAVFQVVGRIVDHDLPEFRDGRIIHRKAGRDEFLRSRLIPAFIIDPNIQNAMNTQGVRTKQGIILTDSLRKSVIEQVGAMLHISGPPLIGA